MVAQPPVIARAGFGAWALDGSGWSFGWGPGDDADSSEVIRSVLDLGVEWIDTNALLDLGDCGDVCAEHLSSDDRPYVFAKCGLIFEQGGHAGAPRHSRWPAAIRHECEASLARLGVERIDLYQLRWPDVSDAQVEDSPALAMPKFAGHRIGLAWYRTSEVDLLTEAMSRMTTSPSAVVVACTVTSRGVAGAIVGSGWADQIEGWIDATTLVLRRANSGEIATAIGRTGAPSDPRLPAVLAA
jgi:hypothetical protein